MRVTGPIEVSSDTPEIAALLSQHHAVMRSTSPAESCHVMDAETLTQVGARIFALYGPEGALGIGALALVSPRHGELKSMHTAVSARGQGVGRRILRHIVVEARAVGLTRLSLETGTASVFSAARALYASEGFEVCAPFGAYRADPLSVFMTRDLGAAD